MKTVLSFWKKKLLMGCYIYLYIYLICIYILYKYIIAFKDKLCMYFS